MPGFFMTFLLLAVAGAWCRYLAETRGPSWLLWVPAPGFLAWLLATVYAGARLATADQAGGEMSQQEAITAVETMADRLDQIRFVAGLGQYAVIATVVVVVALTGWVYLRSAPSEQAG